MGRVVRLLMVLGLVVLLGGAVNMLQYTRASPGTVAPPANAAGAEVSCTPGDQDQYVYRPARLPSPTR